jgi:tRNA U34 2-thiouridine synthase MnmA/TrmU
VVAGEVRWLTAEPPAVGTAVWSRVRHRAALVPGELLRVDGDGAEVALAERVQAVSPGQSVVWYDAEGRVLGGGVIEGDGVSAPRRRGALPLLGG